MSLAVMDRTDFDRRLERVLFDLAERRFFKLIGGGSFSHAETLKPLLEAYLPTGLSAIDVSASLPVVEAACAVLAGHPDRPMLMVSFPLDADPHFRKIHLEPEACISCGACIPACPTETFSLPAVSDDIPLAVETPLCYGCGRCVPLCPTDALNLDPFGVMPELAQSLARPEVEAVELHTTFADPEMIAPLYQDIGPWLQDKLISVCLRPQALPKGQALEFIRRIKAQTPYPLIVQVDGEPMSGSDDPEASLPALKAAAKLACLLPPDCYLTVSGGINAQTAEYLQHPVYRKIQGVGMGTVARKTVWPYLDEPAKASQVASLLVRQFQLPSQKGIIPV